MGAGRYHGRAPDWINRRIFVEPQPRIKAPGALMRRHRGFGQGGRAIPASAGYGPEPQPATSPARAQDWRAICRPLAATATGVLLPLATTTDPRPCLGIWRVDRTFLCDIDHTVARKRSILAGFRRFGLYTCTHMKGHRDIDWLDGGEDAVLVHVDDEEPRPLRAGWYLTLPEDEVAWRLEAGILTGGAISDMIEVWRVEDHTIFRVGRGRNDRERAERLVAHVLAQVPEESEPREYDRELIERSYGGLHAAESEREYRGRRLEGVPEELRAARKHVGLSQSELARRVARRLGRRDVQAIRVSLVRFETGRFPTLPIDVFEAVEMAIAEAAANIPGGDNGLLPVQRNPDADHARPERSR